MSCLQSKEASKLAQRIALAEEQFDQGLRKLTAASKQLASLKCQVFESMQRRDRHTFLSQL